MISVDPQNGRAMVAPISDPKTILEVNVHTLEPLNFARDFEKTDEGIKPGAYLGAPYSSVGYHNVFVRAVKGNVAQITYLTPDNLPAFDTIQLKLLRPSLQLIRFETMATGDSAGIREFDQVGEIETFDIENGTATLVFNLKSYGTFRKTVPVEHVLVSRW